MLLATRRLDRQGYYIHVTKYTKGQIEITLIPYIEPCPFNRPFNSSGECRLLKAMLNKASIPHSGTICCLA